MTRKTYPTQADTMNLTRQPHPQSGMVTVACCQIAPRVGQAAYNVALCCDAIQAAAVQGARVIVLPELAQSGYVFSDSAEARSVAQTINGAAITAWAGLALELGVAIVAGFCELAQSGDLHNSAALIDPSGVRSVYRKAHLWDGEKEIFTPGSAAPPTVDTAFGRIGMVICYDLEFPEWTRMVALQGAELLCVPTNWPRGGPAPTGERPGEVVRVQACASTNRMLVAACCRVGHERGVDWVGGSCIADADGYLVAGPLDGESVATIVAEINPAGARNKWISQRNHVLQDRRPALYGGLLQTIS
jgi:predicted amidohydrolase